MTTSTYGVQLRELNAARSSIISLEREIREKIETALKKDSFAYPLITITISPPTTMYFTCYQITSCLEKISQEEDLAIVEKNVSMLTHCSLLRETFEVTYTLKSVEKTA